MARVHEEEWNFKADEKAVETIKEAVRGIRNVRAEMNVSPKKKAQVYVVSEDRLGTGLTLSWTCCTEHGSSRTNW